MAEIATQVHVEVEDKTGRLAEATEKLKNAGINLRAAVAWVQGDRGHMVFVPEDASKMDQIECPEAESVE